MRTVAELIGKPENPALEAARRAFSHEVGRIEQQHQQRIPSPIELRLEEWEAAERIVNAYLGVTLAQAQGD